MLQLAVEIFAAPEPGDVWRIVCEQASGSLFHADVAGVIEMDIPRRVGMVVNMAPGPATWPQGSLLHDDLIRDHPFSTYVFANGVPPLMKVTDLVSPPEWRRTASHAFMRETLGAQHHLNVPFTGGPLSLGISIMRSDGDFGEQEMALAHRLAPLLESVAGHVRQLARWNGEPSSPLRALRAEVAAELTITPREAVVLAAIAEGLTASAIARRLAISERTVGKHQERLYRKLGVTDRLAAVLRAQHMGLLPPPTPGGGLTRVKQGPASSGNDRQTPGEESLETGDGRGGHRPAGRLPRSRADTVRQTVRTRP
ncbi:response regulator transcription factor [Frankia sp. CNm7]|nr:response regulator transcription factor [Frankia nepalensis]MBL7508964.1 response regulator transcription factor [Frankia nepalensis]MBL7524794.1 response regulator transcription factor [Frankia nepalensis]